MSLTPTGKVLWVAEAVTLAHVARILAAQRALGSKGWASVIACDPRARKFLDEFDGEYLPISSIEPEDFLSALRRGAPLYSESTLRRYVETDLEVIKQASPDCVIGDFRLSLSASARLSGVPYATIASACWSPHYHPSVWPVPELPITRMLPLSIARVLFQSGRLAAFAMHTRPLNRVRRHFGLPALGHDLRRIYTDADFVLYADLPELFPMQNLPPTHRFIGPALWEPQSRMPEKWPVPTQRPLVYVTLGSSGAAALLPTIVAALGEMPVVAMVATAARAKISQTPPNVLVADMLPGIEAAKRSKLVICNGGSLTCYQALSAAVPVIGIASNLDQFLNMQTIERAGAGLTLRADRFSKSGLIEAVDRVLNDARFQSAATVVERWTKQHPLADGIAEFLGQISRRATPSSVIG